MIYNVDTRTELQEGCSDKIQRVSQSDARSPTLQRSFGQRTAGCFFKCLCSHAVMRLGHPLGLRHSARVCTCLSYKRMGRAGATFVFQGSVTCVYRRFPREGRQHIPHFEDAAPVYYLTDRLL